MCCLFCEDNHLTIGFVDEPQPEIVNRIQQFLPSMEIQVCSISSQFFNQVMQSISGLGDNEEESSSEEHDEVYATQTADVT